MKKIKFAITHKNEGIEHPVWEFSSQRDVAQAWFSRHFGNTSSLERIIIDSDDNHYEAGYDGGFFLNRIP